MRNIFPQERNEGLGGDEESPTSIIRPSAKKFLNDRDRENDEDFAFDSDPDSPDNLQRVPLSMRAHSPSPIRRKGSLLEMFHPPNDPNMALTQSQITNQTMQKPRKMTAREIDETYQGDIPNTCYTKLPPNFNEATERKRIFNRMEIEKVDFFMSYFYREMNEAASRLGLKYSHFAVAHGMHHNDNYGSALDVAKLSRVALA